ncbi:hypothetical protein L596_029421 [Steinernema carpocapsae]|uniref:Uncharacterized protein n=1 Tax=Steinernema carpocapsae TaxID=34508 RepID=A0A4U5LUL0_STECR|nr:hypothetical protein L596_029421 [Steinernema carpocapsae]
MTKDELEEYVKKSCGSISVELVNKICGTNANSVAGAIQKGLKQWVTVIKTPRKDYIVEHKSLQVTKVSKILSTTPVKKTEDSFTLAEHDSAYLSASLLIQDSNGRLANKTIDGLAFVTLAENLKADNPEILPFLGSGIMLL